MAGLGDDLRKVVPGESIQPSAKAWNTFIDTSAYVEAQRRVQTADAVAMPALDTGLCYVQNNSGADLDRFNVVGLDVPIILPSDNPDTFAAHLTFSGLTPTTAAHTGKFAVLLEPCAQGNVATAVLSGVCPVKLNVTATGDTLADVDDGSAADLKTGASGAAKILWKESGTGAGKWAYIRIGGGGVLTPGTGKYKVLQLIDTANPGTPGWDWLRFK
jgi:hypothetical protein